MQAHYAGSKVDSKAQWNGYLCDEAQTAEVSDLWEDGYPYIVELNEDEEVPVTEDTDRAIRAPKKEGTN